MEVKADVMFRIEMIRRTLADLPSILQDQRDGTLSENERIALMQEWGADMGTLRVVLDPLYRTGQMSKEREVSYRVLLGKLADVLPILDALRFSRPRVPLATSSLARGRGKIINL